MIEITQGTPEWHQIRLGKVTASRVADVVAKTKTGPSASRTNYLAQLVAERLTGTPPDSFTNAAMQWGNDKEPEARELYEFRTDAEVSQIGFVPHPRITMSGASPDGMIAHNGLVEIKCPNTATHIETLIGQAVPAKYVTQMMWQMACCEREWCDFVSFDPRLPSDMRMFVRRVERDDVLIASLEREVADFLAELDAKVSTLTRLYSTAKAA